MFLEKILRYKPQTNRLQTAFRLLLGAFLLFAGVSHLTVSRSEFLAQVPPWVPLDGGLVVVLSGIAEIVLGIALIILSGYRVLVGLVVAAFFVAIFLGTTRDANELRLPCRTIRSVSS